MFNILDTQGEAVTVLVYFQSFKNMQYFTCQMILLSEASVGKHQAAQGSCLERKAEESEVESLVLESQDSMVALRTLHACKAQYGDIKVP